VRQGITLCVTLLAAWSVEDSRSLARVIRGHPTISSIYFPYEDTLYSALATLPALESITLSNYVLHARPEDESALADSESLGRLLRVASLLSVSFCRFYFTRALCQATANAFMDGTAIASVEFTECSFSTRECAVVMANGLSRNTSVSLDQGFTDALAATLPLNSTLQELSFKIPLPDDDPRAHTDWSQIFGSGTEFRAQDPNCRYALFDGRVAVHSDAEWARIE
jgi:hypothetical protein